MRKHSNSSRTARSATVTAVLTLALLAGGIAPAAAAVTQLNPVRPAHGSFLDTQVATRSSDVEVDAAGATHVAFDRLNTSTTESGRYAYCPPPGTCSNPSQWAQVVVVSGVPRMMAPPQLKLTPSGQPRILFTVRAAAGTDTTSFRYAACDSGCTSAANWTVLDLASTFYKTGQIFDDNGTGAHFFELDNQGRPRFVYSFQGEEEGLYYASCDTGCTASVANWTKTTVTQGTGAVSPLLSIYYSSLALDLTTSGQPRVAGYAHELGEVGGGTDSLAYLACDSACTTASNWSLTAIRSGDGAGLVLRLDNADVPHLVVGGHGDGTAPLEWLWCTTACTAPGGSGWSTADTGITGADADLLFDARNHPHMVFNGAPADMDLGYAWCTGGCDAPNPPWKAQQLDDSQAYDAEIPLPGSPCSTGAWLIGYRPSLALDRAGNPRVGFSGHHVYNDCSFNMRTNGIAVRIDRFNFYPRPADFDGTATTDVSVFRPSSGHWFVQGGATTQWGTSGDIAVPADYDGNGSIDIAVFRPSNGVWFVRGGATVAWGTNGDIPVPGDYDADGKADFAVFRPSTGTWFARMSTAGNGFVQWGTNGDIPVPGDYDGDHATDVAVFRPSIGTWFIGGSSLPDTIVTYGTSGDIPVPADYDGDGDTDVAVFRPSSGHWFVNGGATTPFGLSGDVPTPGDYDGDGDAEIAVFRPTSGHWFVNGGAITQWGTSGDQPLPLPDAIRRIFFPTV